MEARSNLGYPERNVSLAGENIYNLYNHQTIAKDEVV